MQVINGNNIDILKQYPDNHFDAVVTDPPYGLGKEPNAEELMKDWIDKGFHEVSGSGFMGKEWDAFVPQPIFWKEVFRVLKPGGHVLAFYGTRTYDWGVMAMRFAGFEVRDCIQWIYGSGFPKSHNIGKAIDKLKGNDRVEVGKYKLPDVSDGLRKKDWDCNAKSENSNFGASGQNILTKGFTEWEGYGTALKPANEPIVLARKPLEKGLSIAENVLKWGTGAINIDGCRVGVDINDKNHRHNPSKGNEGENSIFGVGGHNGNLKSEGRFPANLILSHSSECECVGTKKIKAISGGCKFNSAFFKSGESNFTQNGGIGDENGEEEIEDWNCVDDCPIKILDQQSGESKSRIGKERGTEKKGLFANSSFNKVGTEYNDKGGASRFFYIAKASKSERNKGLEGFDYELIEGTPTDKVEEIKRLLNL